MGFIEKKQSTKHNDVFLDRVDITDQLEKFVEEYKDGVLQYKVILYYGMGGIGKSRLIKRIYESYNGTDLSVFYYPLEILSQETLPSILFHIRKNFTYTPHFDYALFRFWEYVSYPIKQDELYGFYKKIFLEMTNKIDSYCFSGLSSISDIMKQLIRLFDEREISDKERSRVHELLADKMSAIYEYLVESLANDIQNENKKDKLKFLFLFDAYDQQKGIKTNEDWLKTFINTFDTGIFIVSSREKLDWFRNDGVNEDLVFECSLDCIPEDDVRIYLKEENYSDEQVNLIVKKTGCIPLYLDLAINNYNNCSTEKFVGFENKDELVRHVLDHLSIEEQMLVDYFSVVGLFNQTIFDYALEFNFISPQKYTFESFHECAIVRYIEEYRGLYKIHSILAQNIAHFIDKETTKKIIVNYIKVITKRILPDYNLYDECKYNLIANAYKLVVDEQIDVSEKLTEMLLDMFFYLNAHSFGKDFTAFIETVSKLRYSHLEYICLYIIGKNKRATDISAGLRILQSIPTEKCLFGKHKKSLQCDINYLLSLSGQYNLAEKNMLDFTLKLSDEERSERYYYKGKQYYYDMLMLRGKFNTVINKFLLLENLSEDKTLYYESQKAIGHCYRFNFLFEKAMEYYSTYNDSKNSEAYYLTVYCESYCYFKPQNVFEKYKEALKKNDELNNYNNLGKIHYSVAIAYLHRKKYRKAQEHLKKSSKYFLQSQYKSGLIFKCLAEIYYENAKEHKISQSKVNEIFDLVKDLDNVYEYLLLPLYILQNKNDLIETCRKKFEWIDFDKTIQNVKSFLNLL